jgi:hypothetical protein
MASFEQDFVDEVLREVLERSDRLTLSATSSFANLDWTESPKAASEGSAGS